MDFTRILPFDILCSIFSHPFLQDEDCYTFRTVNREWRKHVPEWTQQLWKTALFDGDDNILIERMTPFLGPHVTSIIFTLLPNESSDDNRDIVLDLLQLLIDNDCNRIISMEFIACGFNDHDRFISILERLGRHTKMIEFSDHVTNLSFLSIIQACPNLEKLAYTPSQIYHIDADEVWHADPGTVIVLEDEDYEEEDEDDDYENSSKKLYNQDSTVENFQFPKMTVLSIDLVMSFRKRLAPIIQRCPNLRVLRTGNVIEEQRFATYSTPITGTNIDMAQTFQWCPVLQFIELNNPYQDEDMKPSSCFWWEMEWDRFFVDPKKGNLFHVVFYEPDGFRSAVPLIDQIIKSQKSLVELALGADRSSDAMWDGISTIEQAPLLTKLHLDGVRCTEESAAAVVQACSSIKDLIINIETDGQGYAPVFQAMRSLTELRALTVNYKSNRFQDNEVNDDEDAGDWRQQLAGRHNRQLAPITNYFNGIDEGTPLERIEIRGRWDLVLTAPFLFSIGCISTLQQLELRPGDTELTADEVVQFIRRLKNTRVAVMRLSMFGNMTSEAYIALAELEYLTNLELVVCEPCQNEDLIYLFKNSNTIDSLLLDMGILSESPFPQEGVDYLQRNKICFAFGPNNEQRGVKLVRYPVSSFSSNYSSVIHK